MNTLVYPFLVFLLTTSKEKNCRKTVGWYTFILGLHPYGLSTVIWIPSFEPIGDDMILSHIFFAVEANNVVLCNPITIDNKLSSLCISVLSSVILYDAN